MKILITGASSFTGYWFVRALHQAGHEVTAALSGSGLAEYDGVRRKRMEILSPLCRLVFNAPFGSPAFLDAITQSQGVDVLCHHWSEVRNYRSPDFDAIEALRHNTLSIALVLQALRQAGGKSVILTGSVFEPDEGAGSSPGGAFNAYGLSKGLTAMSFRFYCQQAGIALRKFVIPNPFGPLEEPRFTDYLLRTWFADQPAAVSTPTYLRDNIHVSLLACAYAAFVSNAEGYAGEHLGPMGYVETQGAFAERVAREMRSRLGLECKLELRNQVDFPEPIMRTNLDRLDAAALGWSEEQAWERFASYCRQKYSGNNTDGETWMELA
jgi:UDP-glucose 4-epimerase